MGASRRGNPTARVGNYAQIADSVGIDDSMKDTMYGTPTSKNEKEYLKSRGGAESAKEAIRRTRKANRQAPVKFSYMEE